MGTLEKEVKKRYLINDLLTRGNEMIRTEILRKLIKEIDDEFCTTGVPIPHRTMRCMAILSKKLQINLPVFGLKESSYMSEGHRISFLISEWYENMYGKRQNTNSDIGYILLLVRGSLIVCRIPNFAGTCIFKIEKNLSTEMAGNETNILLMMDGMTQGFASSLTDDEKGNILTIFQKGINAWLIISDWSHRSLDMINAALNDIKAVASNVSTNFSHLGNAKWSYTQFAEKILKSWLFKAGLERKEVRYLGHDIEAAALVFNKMYKNNIDINLIQNIKGNAGLRYDEINISPDELIQAQDSIFELILSIGESPAMRVAPFEP